jgi:hypothetical protein
MLETFAGFAVALLCAMAPAALPGASAAIEDFEAELQMAPAVKTGWESKGGEFSKASMARSVSNVKRGAGSGEITFEVKQGSWALVQKKVEGAAWLSQAPKAISFWVRGGGVGKMTVELEESYTFKWRKEVPLTDMEWHFVKLSFKEFACADKTDISPADLVAVKFVFYEGTSKILLDDIQIEFEE